jgi:creatinine amidohydrolase
VLHISPEVVDMAEATSEDAMRYHSDFVAGDTFLGRQRVAWSTWYLQPSRTGIYGDPTVADAGTGRVILDAAVRNGARFLAEFHGQTVEGA